MVSVTVLLCFYFDIYARKCFYKSTIVKDGDLILKHHILISLVLLLSSATFRLFSKTRYKRILTFNHIWYKPYHYLSYVEDMSPNVASYMLIQE